MTTFKMRLPATSANLGPGFDAVGLAMALYLEVDATPDNVFTIAATGRDVELVGSLERNLMLCTYRELAPCGPSLSLQIRNEIPLGMGCGSSAAALLAGVLLANKFGSLGWSDAEIVAEACRREGHPDNVAACFYGGLTVSAMTAGSVTTATFGLALPWRLLLALPSASLATVEARALLPESYSRADAVVNVQATALLVSAFALARPDLLLAGTRDRMHQPYRSKACALLEPLLPLAGASGVYSVTLSGAGPSILLICDPQASQDTLIAKVEGTAHTGEMELLMTQIGSAATFE